MSFYKTALLTTFILAGLAALVMAHLAVGSGTPTGTGLYIAFAAIGAAVIGGVGIAIGGGIFYGIKKLWGPGIGARIVSAPLAGILTFLGFMFLLYGVMPPVDTKSDHAYIGHAIISIVVFSVSSLASLTAFIFGAGLGQPGQK